MTDTVSPAAPLAFSRSERTDKRRAFRLASRHSRAVKILRLLMFAGAVAVLVSIIVVAVFDPFHKQLPGGVAIESVSLDGTKVTMARPRLSGYHKDGRPYEIVAASAVQDIKVPNLFTLHDLDARLTMPDKTVTHVTAQLGRYDSTGEHMDLTSEVRIDGSSGLAVRAHNAQVEFKTGGVVTREPVSVAMKGSTLTADGMVIVDSGRQVTFEGHVHTVLLPEDATVKAPASGPDGSAAPADGQATTP